MGEHHPTRREFLAAAGTAAGVLAGAYALGAMPRTALARRGRAGVILDWREIAPGIHVTPHQLNGGNVLIASGETDVMVVDSKFPWAAGSIRNDAIALGPGTETPTLVNTHHHGDHTGGNCAFREGSVRMAHPKAAERIEAQIERFMGFVERAPEHAGRFTRGNEAAMRQAEKISELADTLEPADWAPTLAVADGTRVDLGGLSARLHAFGRGHTDTDLVVHIAELNVVHVGDLIFNALNPFFDQDGGVTVFGWIDALRQVRELCDINTIVVPGHGPLGDRELINAQIRYHEQLIDAVRVDIEAGVSKEDAAKKQHPFMSGLGYLQVAPRAIEAVYDELSSAG